MAAIFLWAAGARGCVDFVVRLRFLSGSSSSSSQLSFDTCSSHQRFEFSVSANFPCRSLCRARSRNRIVRGKKCRFRTKTVSGNLNELCFVFHEEDVLILTISVNENHLIKSVWVMKFYPTLDWTAECFKPGIPQNVEADWWAGSTGYELTRFVFVMVFFRGRDWTFQSVSGVSLPFLFRSYLHPYNYGLLYNYVTSSTTWQPISLPIIGRWINWLNFHGISKRLIWDPTYLIFKNGMKITNIQRI